MARPPLPYEERKARARMLLEDRLRDLPEDGSLTLTMVRRLFHNSGRDEFMEPVLRALQEEGLVTIWQENRAGMIYLTDKWRAREAQGR